MEIRHSLFNSSAATRVPSWRHGTAHFALLSRARKQADFAFSRLSKLSTGE